VNPFFYFEALETQEPSHAADGMPALFALPFHGIRAGVKVLRYLQHTSPSVIHDYLLCLELWSKSKTSYQTGRQVSREFLTGKRLTTVEFSCKTPSQPSFSTANASDKKFNSRPVSPTIFKN